MPPCEGAGRGIALWCIVTTIEFCRRVAEGSPLGVRSVWLRLSRACDDYPYLTGFVLFALGWAVLSLPWLSGAVTIPYDAKAHFQAQIQFLANAISSGQSPFWNPDAFSGQPQIADPQSLIFSPAILLAWLSGAPSFQLVDAYVLALLGMGGLAVILLFREMKWPVAGAIVAAFAFSFGASAALRVQHIGQVQSLAFLMVTQWLLVRTLVRASFCNAIALGVSAALMIVEPDQVALLGAYVLAAHVVWHIAQSGNRLDEIRRLAIPLGAAGLVCVVLVSVPLLLTYLFVETTTRAVIPFSEAARGSLHPASLLSAFIGDLFGAIDPKIEYWGPFSELWNQKYWSNRNYALTQNMSHIYIGALPVLATLAGCLTGLRRWPVNTGFFAAAALAMLLYSLGSHTPFFQFAYEVLPGVSGFRRPADATFLLGAYGALVGGCFVNQILVPQASYRRPTARNIAIFGGACCGVFALAATIALLAGRLDVAGPKLLLASMWSGAAIILPVFLRTKGLAAGTAAAVALTTLMTADLWANNGPNESTALPPAQYEVLRPDSRNPTICEIKRNLALVEAPDRRDRIELVGVGFHWPNAGLVHQIENTLGYNPLRLDDYSLATGAQDQAAGWDQRKFSALFPSYKSLLADMLGLRLVVSGVPIEQIDRSLRPGDFPLVARTGEAFIYENPRAFSRVMFATSWQVADFDEIIDKGKWPDFDPKQMVLLDSEPNPFPRRVSQPGENRVRIIRYENTRIEIEAEAAQPGFIVLNDIWHPWWSVKIDGQPGEILKANVLFRAVQVDAGKHRLVFEFNPVTGAFAELKEKLFDTTE